VDAGTDVAGAERIRAASSIATSAIATTMAKKRRAQQDERAMIVEPAFDQAVKRVIQRRKHHVATVISDGQMVLPDFVPSLAAGASGSTRARNRPVRPSPTRPTSKKGLRTQALIAGSKPERATCPSPNAAYNTGNFPVTPALATSFSASTPLSNLASLLPGRVHAAA
jgi:hypothetical protein